MTRELSEIRARMEARRDHDDAMARVLGYRSVWHMQESRSRDRVLSVVAGSLWDQLSLAEKRAVYTAFTEGWMRIS